MMRHPISFLQGCIAGAVAMYFLDQRSGAYRRSLVRDKITATGNDLTGLAQAKSKRAADRAHGAMATGRPDGQTSRPPESDAQLHERVRSQLGHFVQHPKLVHTDVHEGCVTLTGHILSKEVDKLVSELRGMTGVQKVQNQLEAHGSEAELQRVAGQQGSAKLGTSAQAQQPVGAGAPAGR